MTYLVRLEEPDHTVIKRKMVNDMASAERQAKQWVMGVKLTNEKIFRWGRVGEFQVTILQVN